MTTAYFSHPACLAHENPPGHAEQVARLEYIEAALAAPEFGGLDRRDAPICDENAPLLAHPRSHLDAIKAAAPTKGWTQIDADTSMSPGSLEAAYRAVGGGIAAVDSVLNGEVTNAFVACRPPGHHAEKTRAMGFCLFSNVAIAALHALENHGLKRVAVLDFDVHHGNGTQDVLWDEARVRFASSHQVPLYPGTGAAGETGGQDNVLNFPLVSGSAGREMRTAWGQHILPWVEDFAPELILVSAGFDAHENDPLAGLNWTTDDFTWLSQEICAMAGRVCNGRLVSSLEGGYDLSALGESVAAHVNVLMEQGA